MNKENRFKDRIRNQQLLRRQNRMIDNDEIRLTWYHYSCMVLVILVLCIDIQ
jgi:hypothetical protein